MPIMKNGTHGPMPYTEARHLLNPLRTLIQSPKKLIKLLDLKPDSTVLELGPGAGYFSPELARAVPEGKLVLVDVQQEMLDMARERLQGGGFENVEYYRGDAASLPVESKSFDAVFLSMVLGEVPNREACLKEIRRVLRPDGLLSVTEMMDDPDFIPMPEMLRSIEAAGFELSAKHGGRFYYTVNARRSA